MAKKKNITWMCKSFSLMEYFQSSLILPFVSYLFSLPFALIYIFLIVPQLVILLSLFWFSSVSVYFSCPRNRNHLFLNWFNGPFRYNWNKWTDSNLSTCSSKQLKSATQQLLWCLSGIYAVFKGTFPNISSTIYFSQTEIILLPINLNIYYFKTLS